MARVRARVAGARFVDEQAELVVRAEFTRTGSGAVVGRLFLIDDGGETPLRQLEGASCEDAVEGVALILAITLDPAAADTAPVPTGTGEPAASTAEPTAGSSGDSERPGTATEAGTARSSSGATTDPGAARPFEDEYSNVTLDDDAPEQHGTTHFDIGVYVAGVGALGPAPELMPGLTVYALFGFENASVWSPAVVLGGVHLSRGELAEWGGTAAFALDALTLDLCVVRYQALPFEARACAGALLGRLAASGTDTRNPEGTVSRPFVGLGPLGMLGWDLGAHVELSARLTAHANLIRDEFEFRPRVFHGVDPFTFLGSVGIGGRWR
jgi:hypothetical protein